MPYLTVKIANSGTAYQHVTDNGLVTGTSRTGHMWVTLTDAYGQPRDAGFGPVTPGSPFGPGRIVANDSSVYLSTTFNRQIYITEDTYNAIVSFIENPSKFGFSNTYLGIGPSNNCIDFVYAILSIADGKGFPPELRAAWPTWNDNFLMKDLLDRIDYNERVADFGYSDPPIIPNDPWGAIYNLAHCFAAGTMIAMADGSKVPIENVNIGDLVLAFNPELGEQTGELSPKKVTKVFHNWTDHWFLLQAENSKDWQHRGLLVTSGHRFLASNGLFKTIKDILCSDSVIILSNGSKIKVKHKLFTKDNINELDKYNSEFALNLKNEIKWNTYNFEVDDYHTYIACDVKVHNDSIFDFIPPGSTLDRANILFEEGLPVGAGYWNENGSYTYKEKLFGLNGNVTGISEKTYYPPGTLGALSVHTNIGYQLNPDGSRIPGSTEILDFEYDGSQISLENLGNAFGSTIGGLLGGNTLVGQTLGATIGGTITQNFAEYLQKSGTLDQGWLQGFGTTKSAFEYAFGDIHHDFARNGLGAISGILMAELAEALGLEGFTGGLFTTVGTTITSQLLTNAYNTYVVGGQNPLTNRLYSLSDGFDPTSLVTNIGTSVGGYLGTYLASQLIQPDSELAGITSSLGSSFGSILGTVIGTAAGGGSGVMAGASVGSMIFPGIGTLIGAFIGTIFGTALGNAMTDDEKSFGHIAWDPDSGQLVAFGFEAKNDGKWDTFLGISTGICDTVNKIVDITGSRIIGINGANSQDFYQKGTTYTVYYNDGVAYDFMSRNTPQDQQDEAWIRTADLSVMKWLRSIQLGGGDAIVEHVFRDSNASTIAGFVNDLEVARSYSHYIRNAEVINLLIATEPESPFAIGWILTLMRAYEIGLDLITEMDHSGTRVDDELSGTTLNDTMWGYDGDDVIYGKGGNDTLYGGAGNDMLNGGSGRDILHGEDGDDELHGGAGADKLYGGNGNDRLYGDGDDDELYGEDGDDYLNGGDGSDLLHGGNGRDILFGGADNDELHGDAGDDELYGDDGIDRLFGGLGNDKLSGGAGEDYLDGGDGDDELRGGDGDDRLYGGVGNDILYGNEGDDLLDGGDGDDALHGGAGNDVLIGGFGDDTLYGEDGDDHLSGDDGNDRLYGGSGNDTLLGGNGDDELDGEEGDDILRGGAGNDLLSGGDGDDELYGEVGDDILHGDVGNDKLFGGAGNDMLYGGNGHDVLDGGEGDDILYGGAGNDQLNGGTGNDILYGGAGDDFLYGGDGDDILVGGGGNDFLEGGTGFDTAVFDGNRADYEVVLHTAINRFSVEDKRNGSPDGTDIVDIEQFRFADGDILFDEIEHLVNDHRNFSWQIDNSDGSKTSVSWNSWLHYPGTPVFLTDITITSFNESGQKITETVIYDEGGRRASVWDIDDEQPWTSIQQYFSADGNLTHQVTFQDNGGYIVKQWNHNASPWPTNFKLEDFLVEDRKSVDFIKSIYDLVNELDEQVWRDNGLLNEYEALKGGYGNIIKYVPNYKEAANLFLYISGKFGRDDNIFRNMPAVSYSDETLYFDLTNADICESVWLLAEEIDTETWNSIGESDLYQELLALGLTGLTEKAHTDPSFDSELYDTYLRVFQKLKTLGVEAPSLIHKTEAEEITSAGDSINYINSLLAIYYTNGFEEIESSDVAMAYQYIYRLAEWYDDLVPEHSAQAKLLYEQLTASLQERGIAVPDPVFTNIKVTFDDFCTYRFDPEKTLASYFETIPQEYWVEVGLGELYDTILNFGTDIGLMLEIDHEGFEELVLFISNMFAEIGIMTPEAVPYVTPEKAPEEGPGEKPPLELRPDQWSTVETHYLPDGARDWEIKINQDNSRLEHYWDPENQQPWTDYTASYDPLGRLAYQHINNDDGTYSDHKWDVENQQDWWTEVVHYTSNGRMISRVYVFDDGHRTEYHYDWNDSQTWREIQRDFDSSGRMTLQHIWNDDGTRNTHLWDAANRENWSEIDQNFDSLGRQTWQWNLFDNSETEHRGWDPANTEAWYHYYAHFNSSGQKTYQHNYNDDGTSEEWAWDLRNLEKWTSVYTKLITSTWQPLFRETHLDGKAFPFVYGGPPIYTEGFTQEWWNYDGAKHYSYLRYEFQWAPVHYEHEDYVVLHDGRVSTGHNSLFWGCQILWETIYPPIILDLNGDGLDIRQLGESTARFDWNSDGIRDATAWVGPDDGFLIIDVDGDGIIDQTKEISFVEWAPEAETDLEALRIAFDSNGDGVFDAQDDRWGEFRIWQDLNQNGIADAGELKTLEDHGIVGIDLTTSLDGAKTYDDGSRIFGTGTFIKEDGSTGTIGDVGLGYVPGDIESQNGAIVSSAADEFMIGITEQDHFVFKQDFGNDVVFGFDAGGGFDDVIDFRDNTFADYEAVLAAAVQVGDDVVLTLDDHNSITLSNVQLSHLHQDDFRFAA